MRSQRHGVNRCVVDRIDRQSHAGTARLGTAGAGIAAVTHGDAERIGAVEVGGGGVTHRIAGCQEHVDAHDAAAELHACGAVGGDCHVNAAGCCCVECHGAIGYSQGHGHVARAGIDICNADACDENRCVFVGALGRGHDDGGRIVDSGDRDGHVVRITQGAVAGAHAQCVVAVVVERRRVGDSAGGAQGRVDLGDGARQGDGSCAAASNGGAAACDDQAAMLDRQGHGHGVAACIDVVNAQASDDFGRVFGSGLCCRHGVDRGIVDGIDRDGHGVGVAQGRTAGVAPVAGAHAQGVCAAVIGRRGVGHRIVSAQGGVDLRHGARQGHAVGATARDGGCATDNGQGAVGHTQRDGHAAAGGIDVGHAQAGDDQRRVF